MRSQIKGTLNHNRYQLRVQDLQEMEHGNHFVQVLKHRGHKRFQSMVCCSHKQFGGEEQALRAAEAFLQLCIDGYSKEQLGWAKAEYLKHLSSNKTTELG